MKSLLQHYLMLLVALLSLELHAQEMVNLEVYYCSHDNRAKSTCYNENGSSFLAGEFNGEIIIGFNYVNNPNFNSAYFVKKSPSGEIPFLKTFQSSGYLSVSTIISKNNNVIIGGTYSDSLFIGTDTLINGNFKGMYLAFFDTLGNYQYTINPNSYSSELHDIAFVSDSEIVFTGEFYGHFEIHDIYLNGELGFNMFLIKYDYVLNEFIWGKSSSGVATNGKSVRSDLNSNIIVTGSYGDGTTFDGQVLNGVMGDHNQFVAKYSSNGNLIWIKTITGPVQTHGLGLAVTNEGEIYVSGEFEFSIDIPTIGTFVSVGLMDAYIAKIDTDGSFCWGKSFGSDDNDHGIKIGIDQYDNPILLINAGKTIHFQNYDLSASGFRDPLLVKLNKVNGDYIWHHRIPSNPPSGIVEGNSFDIYQNTISICGSNRTGILFNGDVFESPNLDDSFWAIIIDTNVFDPSLSIIDFGIIQNKSTIMPNPFEDYFKVTSSEKVYSIDIYDNRFSHIHSIDYEGSETILIPSSLPSGIYHIKINTSENHFFLKAFKR